MIRNTTRILRSVFERARSWNIRFNKKKIQLKVPQVRYLGHIISAGGIKPDDDKVRAIVEMKQPVDKKGVQRLLGTITFLSKYIANFSALTEPLRALVRHDAEFIWSNSHQMAFENIKCAVSSAPVLRFFDPTRPVVIQTDASATGLGACLMQDGRPVAFCSRALTDPETRWATCEKELLGIVFSCNKFNHYIYGHDDVTVETDHRPLEAIFKTAICTTTPRLQRMLLSLLKFRIHVVFKQGKHMYIADTLSRAHLSSTECDRELQMT